MYTPKWNQFFVLAIHVIWYLDYISFKNFWESFLLSLSSGKINILHKLIFL